jgi:hypothetical protein
MPPPDVLLPDVLLEVVPPPVVVEVPLEVAEVLAVETPLEVVVPIEPALEESVPLPLVAKPVVIDPLAAVVAVARGVAPLEQASSVAKSATPRSGSIVFTIVSVASTC